MRKERRGIALFLERLVSVRSQGSSEPYIAMTCAPPIGAQAAVD